MRTDAERLRLFCDLVKKARGRRAIEGRTIKAGLTVHTGQDGQSVETRLGDEDDVRALMIDLRKFLAREEDVYFNRIANIFEQAITDDEMRESNRELREHWRIVLAEGPMQPLGGRTPEGWFNLILNGEIFHNDAAKYAEFESLPEDLQAIGRMTVNSLMMRMVHILVAERSLIEDALERGVFDFKLLGSHGSTSD